MGDTWIPGRGVRLVGVVQLPDLPGLARAQPAHRLLTKHLLDGDDSTFTGRVRPAKPEVCPAADTPTRGRAAAAADLYAAYAT
jgi:hypothetical protein